MCNNVLTYLFSELSSNVAQSFFAVETEGSESPIAKHLYHLSVFCTHTGREGECGIVNEWMIVSLTQLRLHCYSYSNFVLYKH